MTRLPRLWLVFVLAMGTLATCGRREVGDPVPPGEPPPTAEPAPPVRDAAPPADSTVARDAATPDLGAAPSPPLPPPPTPADAGGARDGAADASATAAPDRFIPMPTGPCPDFAPGMITVRPGGVARSARVWMSTDAAARAQQGPLVFYWYGTGGAPSQAEGALGRDVIAAITAQGGLVVAPVHDPAAGMWPWYLVASARDDDLRLADEVVACAVAKVGIDRRRIHSVGFSAGAMHTVQMSYRRSGYVASVVTYSGAKVTDIPDQDPDNKLAAMIFHGGANDRVIISFQTGSEAYKSALTAAGRFGLICNHGLGHRVPAATAAAWRFLERHPFGIGPSPYAAELPADLPPYCMR